MSEENKEEKIFLAKIRLPAGQIDTEAQFNLGMNDCRDGKIRNDEKEAFRRYLDPQYNLGAYCLLGIGETRNYREEANMYPLDVDQRSLKKTINNERKYIKDKNEFGHFFDEKNFCCNLF